MLSASPADGNNKDESFPYSNKTKKVDRTRVKKDTADGIRMDERKGIRGFSRGREKP